MRVSRSTARRGSQRARGPKISSSVTRTSLARGERRHAAAERRDAHVELEAAVLEQERDALGLRRRFRDTGTTSQALLLPEDPDALDEGIERGVLALRRPRELHGASESSV